MAGKFDGKVAVVTGGNSGIGLATAERFAAEGAKVFVTGRRQAELDAAVTRIGRGAVGVRGDVSSPADLDRLFAAVKAQAGRVDVLFANAGLAEVASVEQVTEAHFDKLFNVNVKGVLFAVQKALPLMPDGAAVVVNASVVSAKGFPGMGVYAATKAALRSFARTWANDLRARRIRVNVVSPGPIETPGVALAVGGPDAARAMWDQMTPGIPQGRIGQADEIAKAVAFLASDDASYVNGVELFVDGGMVAV